MAEPSLDIRKMVDDLSVDCGGGSESQELEIAAKVIGLFVPIEKEIGAGLAECLALGHKSDTVQTGVYLLTQAVVLESAKLVGIGSGLTVLNLSGFIMSQLREQVKEINQKLDTILDAPLAEAVEFFDMAMIQLEVHLG